MKLKKFTPLTKAKLSMVILSSTALVVQGLI